MLTEEVQVINKKTILPLGELFFEKVKILVGQSTVL